MSKIGHDCPVFKRPPAEGPDALTLDNVVDWHMRNNPGYTYAVLAPKHGRARAEITYAELGEAVHKAAIAFKVAVGSFEGLHPPVVCILSPSDGLIYTTVVLAIIRAGYTPFALSVRNSPIGISHLVKQTGCKYAVVNREAGQGALRPHLSALEDITGLHLLDMPTTETLYPRLIAPTPDCFHPDPKFKPLPQTSRPDHVTSMILHSSGSTAFPKPIYMTSYMSRYFFANPRDVEVFRNERFLGLVFPMFHIAGFSGAVFWTASYFGTTTYFRPALKGEIIAPPTATEALQALQDADATIMYAPPLFVEAWGSSPPAIKVLEKVKAVMCGGGQLPHEVGNTLVKRGVKLYSIYGSTELGATGVNFAEHDMTNWEYWRLADSIRFKLVPHGGRLFEMEFHPHPQGLHPNTNRPLNNLEGTEPFYLRDLVERHPSKPSLFRCVGRTDDQIMLSNGEKTNPVPIETVINKHPFVSGSLIFGRSKPQNGVLVEPAPGHEVNLDDHGAAESFIDSIWPSIQAANAAAPSHSRIFRDLVRIVDPRAKPLPRTDKGTLQRKKALSEFESEIEIAYAEQYSLQAESEANGTGTPLTVDGAHALVKDVVASTIGLRASELEMDRNMFSMGCDSLQADHIRQVIVQALRRAHITQDIVPTNLVYNYSTTNKLSSWLAGVLEGRPSRLDQSWSVQARIQDMQAMVDKYTPRREITTAPINPGHQMAPCSRKVVLMTGTSGSLGAHALERLLRDASVDRIFAMGRAPSVQARKEKQIAGFTSRGLEARLLEDERLVLLAGESPDDIGHDQRQEIIRSVTHIIHASYPLNFNWLLDPFEPQVRCTRALADLAAESPNLPKPTIVFASSIATLQSIAADDPAGVPEELVDISTAVGIGYGESKRVCELVLSGASKASQIPVVNVRIGQLCGSRATGAWNTTDAIPILVQSAKVLGCLPGGDDSVAWLRVDDAASALLELAYAPRDPGSCVYRHLVHPRSATWGSLVGPLAQRLGVPTVPYGAWLERLKAAAASSQADAQRLPALKLLEYFAAPGVGVSASPRPALEAFGLRRLATAATAGESPTLRGCEPLDAGDAAKWLAYWEGEGLFVGGKGA